MHGGGGGGYNTANVFILSGNAIKFDQLKRVKLGKNRVKKLQFFALKQSGNNFIDLFQICNFKLILASISTIISCHILKKDIVFNIIYNSTFLQIHHMIVAQNIRDRYP